MFPLAGHSLLLVNADSQRKTEIIFIQFTSSRTLHNVNLYNLYLDGGNRTLCRDVLQRCGRCQGCALGQGQNCYDGGNVFPSL